MNATLNKILRPVLEALPENNRMERIWVLAKVDFKKRYYNNSLGLVWALINPIFQVGMYYVVFTYMLKGRIENYALYLFCGLLFWMFFKEGSNKGLTIMKQKKYLIENIQFNKLDLFYSSTLSVFLGFLFNLMAYFVISLIIGTPLHATAVFFPILVINIFLLALAVSILLSTLNIYIKDIVHLWSMVIMAGFWATPIFLPKEVFAGNLEMVLYINPLAGIIINARETILYGNYPDMTFLVWCFSYALLLLGVAIVLFKKFSHKAVEKL